MFETATWVCRSGSPAREGFYFDLSVDPPGPLAITTEDLIDHLRQLNTQQDRYQEPYARFRDKFCPHDDGHATDRFLERFF